MPCCASTNDVHREKLGDDPTQVWFNACVARPVGKHEVGSNPKAKAALDKEWAKLRKIKCWTESDVREASAVVAWSKNKDQPVHFGRIFAICVEKNAELPQGDPRRKFKGRVVFQGNNVKDAYNDWAIFEELSSAPPTMHAGKAADAFGCFPEYTTEIADAESAYTQAELGGTQTYVRLPRDQWPQSWPKFRDPVCPLRFVTNMSIILYT
jgi:hypothetical protein